MSTFDAATGTGGLDASLMFELERPENIGSAFNNTFAAMWDFLTPRSSVSDLLALSVVAAAAACDGPKIPFRAGRIDATEAGPAGVPKPEDDLESTRQTFKRAGFNDGKTTAFGKAHISVRPNKTYAEDMITMVACGHSLGNIHSVDFPEMVAGETSEENIAHFDTSPTNFDNAVVTEYLENETANPLVVGANDTMNSDKRIFGSDGNATMSSLSDPVTFKSKCTRIFERMIDTVPASVILTEPLDIVDVKPYVDPPRLQSDGSLLFEGRIRVRNNAETGINGDDLEVSLDYLDRQGSRDADMIVASRARSRGGQSYGFWGNTFTWFEFSRSINASTGISNFNILLKTLSTGTTFILDNSNTGGYPVDSDLLYQQTDSCVTGTGTTRDLSLVIALRKELAGGSTQPLLHLAHRVARPGVLLPRLEVESVPFLSVPGLEKSGFQYFRANATLDASGWSTTFDITMEDSSAGGKHELGLLKTSVLSGTCTV
ncbi:WSC domain-containing protein [Colletotrichum siamense]|uniref:WSC domain-containing protein n=1 Tax=Colletotrichum siamense TaxID=690259 RepID=UPI001872AAF3|nr:WSC domain-containing protein [Colletotrichum siamense]KAF5515474.1 WSC domain-containing protein [Colletotrichum siamense]